MFEKYILKNLKNCEKEIEIVREYGWMLFLPVFAGLVVIMLDFFFMYPLWRLGWWGVLIFFLVIIIAVVFIFRKVVIWSLNVFLITDSRVIDLNQTGLFSKSVTEAGFDKIQDISYNKKGFFATIFDYGDVIVKTASHDECLELKNVHEPARVQSLLADTQEKFEE